MTPEQIEAIRAGLQARVCHDVDCQTCKQDRLLLSHLDTQAARIAELEAQIQREHDNQVWLACDCEAYQWLVDDGWTPPPGGCKEPPAFKKHKLCGRIAELEAEVARLRNTNALDEAKSERLVQRINDTLGE